MSLNKNKKWSRSSDLNSITTGTHLLCESSQNFRTIIYAFRFLYKSTFHASYTKGEKAKISQWLVLPSLGITILEFFLYNWSLPSIGITPHQSEYNEPTRVRKKSKYLYILLVLQNRSTTIFSSFSANMIKSGSTRPPPKLVVSQK